MEDVHPVVHVPQMQTWPGLHCALLVQFEQAPARQTSPRPHCELPLQPLHTPPLQICPLLQSEFVLQPTQVPKEQMNPVGQSTLLWQVEGGVGPPSLPAFNGCPHSPELGLHCRPAGHSESLVHPAWQVPLRQTVEGGRQSVTTRQGYPVGDRQLPATQTDWVPQSLSLVQSPFADVSTFPPPDPKQAHTASGANRNGERFLGTLPPKEWSALK